MHKELNPNPIKQFIKGEKYFYFELWEKKKKTVIYEAPCDYAKGAVWLKGGTWIDGKRLFEFLSPENKYTVIAKNGSIITSEVKRI